MKKISVLGSTGSVGLNALRVIRHLSSEWEVAALAAHSNLEMLEEQIREFRPSLVAVGDVKKAAELRRRMPGISVAAGEEGVCEVAALPGIDMVLLAMSGCAGLRPAAAAIQRGRRIGIANKEILVSAGEWIMSLAATTGAEILPIDSEHSAIFQCLQGNDARAVRRVILTASGGPFRTHSFSALKSVSQQEALSHPNWKMGKKISVDSSTLMNKGLEKIEASRLFHLPPQSIDIIIHPQSIIHSFVEYCDGSLMAQLGEADMALPIQYALTYPDRKPGLFPPFDFLKHPQLTFEKPDREKFPCLRLAEEALLRGKSFPCALNAANEVLVDRFLHGELSWIQIGEKLERLMSFHRECNMITLEAVFDVDREMRKMAGEV